MVNSLKQKLSLIIPVKDEQESLNILCDELLDTLKNLDYAYEIIFIDDGSKDQTFETLREINKKNEKVSAIKLRGNFGKSIALQTGFDNASGDIIITIDGDLQDNPSEIPNFLNKINEGYDLVSGWKKRRVDPSLSKVIPSRIINFLTRLLTGVQIHDVNCGYKAYRKEVVENLNLYGELYRYIPVLAAKQNFKVGEIQVEHRSRKFGKSKFGWSRGIKGILDLLTIVFITGYLKRPGHFFGTLGLLSFTTGFIIGLYISYIRFSTGSIQYRTPLLFLGILLMIIGVQLVSTGLLAELIISYNNDTSTQKYIKETIK